MQKKKEPIQHNFRENDDSDLRVFCLFVCFTLLLLSLQFTLKPTDTEYRGIQNKNVNQWMQNLTSDAPVLHDGTCVYRQQGTVCREWGTSQVGGTRSSGFFYTRRGASHSGARDVTLNKKESYSEAYTYIFLYFCYRFHTKLLDFLSRHAINNHCKKVNSGVCSVPEAK